MAFLKLKNAFYNSLYKLQTKFKLKIKRNNIFKRCPVTQWSVHCDTTMQAAIRTQTWTKFTQPSIPLESIKWVPCVLCTLNHVGYPSDDHQTNKYHTAPLLTMVTKAELGCDSHEPTWRKPHILMKYILTVMRNPLTLIRNSRIQLFDFTKLWETSE